MHIRILTRYLAARSKCYLMSVRSMFKQKIKKKYILGRVFFALQKERCEESILSAAGFRISALMLPKKNSI